MKVLLDECVPKPLLKRLSGHIFSTAQEMGWRSIKNGELLALAEDAFDIFLTSDQNLRYQQNLKNRRIAVIVLSTNLWPAIRTNCDLIQSALDCIQPGEWKEVNIPVEI
jgi:hypothetical protein